MLAFDDDGIPGNTGNTGNTGIRAIQHYLVRVAKATLLGNMGLFRPLCGQKGAYYCYPGSRVFPVFPCIPCIPCIPGEAGVLYLWSFLIALGKPAVKPADYGNTRNTRNTREYTGIPGIRPYGPY